MVYLGVNNGNGNSASSTGGQNKNGTRTPELVDLDGEKTNERNGDTNGIQSLNSNQISINAELKVEKNKNEDGNWSNSDDDDSGSESAKIRIGKDYQVDVPKWIPLEHRRPQLEVERALLVWSPNPNLPQQKLDEYIQVSKEKYGYNAEQALGMLFWHKHDLDRAIQDLANFTPFPDEWTVEDKVLFEQAFQFHGKSFNRIRQMMPQKSIANLVKHYYSWKKLRARTSLMDNQARVLQTERKKPGYYEGTTAIINSSGLTETSEKKIEIEEPTFVKESSISLEEKVMKNNSRPPKGMYINHDDLVTMATGPNTQGEHLLKSMDREIVSYKRVVQNNKQLLSGLHKKSRDRTIIEPYKIPTDISSRINAKWSNEELLLGVQGIRTFGKNFTAIAEVIGTKTESHVRSFFVNYRRRYNLDTALKEYEEEHGPAQKEDVEMNDNVSGKSNSSSGTGTPRGQNSRSVSPTNESSKSKSLEINGLPGKNDSSAS